MRLHAIATAALLALAYPGGPCAQGLPHSTAIDLSALVDAADRDRDGRVDAAEMDAALARSRADDGPAFERFWVERNTPFPGVVEDVAVGGELARSALRMLAEADADGDGTVSREEAQSYLSRQPATRRQAVTYGLAMADADFDGTATAEEIVVLARRVGDLGATAASDRPPEDEPAAREAARRDFLEERTRERRQVREAFRSVADANNAAPLGDLRREVLANGLR